MTDAPFLGRAVLLGAAYVPAVVIAAVRGFPSTPALVALVVSGVVVVLWGVILWYLATTATKERPLLIVEANPLDKDVAAYVASYLLPIAAASSPTTADWVAYGLCAVLFALIAWATGMWAINPLVFAVGLRVWEVKGKDGRIRIVLARSLVSGAEIKIASAVTLSMKLDDLG